MNPSLPNEDLVFCLKFPILNLTQRLLDRVNMSSKAFHNMGCMQSIWSMLQDRLEAATFFLGIDIH